MIFVENRKRSMEKLKEEYPDAYILDITSSSPFRYGQLLSPFYPHRNIPIPGESGGMTACSVEGIWQGLKVFEHAGIDRYSFRNDTMKNIKRTVRKFGKPLGHQYGVLSKQLLNYADAKRLIYAPSYKYVLDNIPEVQHVIAKIKKQAEVSDIVLLDYNLNPDNRDASKPLSHAEFVKMYIEGRYPTTEEDFRPLTEEELAKIKKTRKPINSLTPVQVKASELNNYLADIVAMLQKEELTATGICKKLGIKINSTSFNHFLMGIKGIRVIKVKRSTCYTLRFEDLRLF